VQHWNIFWKVPLLKRQKGKSCIVFGENVSRRVKRDERKGKKKNYTGEKNKRKRGNAPFIATS
jgi:hypothetical protein